MVSKISEKLYLLGYIIISFGIIQLGYFGFICFNLGHEILNNKERTIVDANSIITIGKSQFHYANIILGISFYLFLSIVPMLLGFFIIKKGKKKKSCNTID